MIKIIGGRLKRSNLFVPNNLVRPTSAMKREAIFSILESYALKNSIDLYNKKSAIDLFAGSGSLGIEAISRGISKVFFYENNSKVLDTLETNCKKIIKKKNYQIIKADIMRVTIRKNELPVSLIFIDPPYKKYDIEFILENIVNNNILESYSIIILETEKNEVVKLNKSLKIFKKKTFGKTLLSFIKLL